MNAAKIKALILLGIFILTTALALSGKGQAQLWEGPAERAEAVALPIVCFSWEESRINPLYAQTQSWDAGAEVPTVFPLREGMTEIELHLTDASEQPRILSYELRGDADQRLIDKGDITEFEGSRGSWSCRISFPDILTPDTYYQLFLTLPLSAQTAYYQTRIIKLSDSETLDRLSDFGQKMQDDLFTWETARAYVSQLETDTKTDKNTLALVNINANMDQFSWGNSKARKSSDSWMSIEAIQGDYVYLSFSYLAQADYSENIPLDFRVHESMTLQRYHGNVYLVAYERHMEQLWKWQEYSVTPNGFLLGVQEEKNIKSMASPNGDYLAFSVAGELYLYQHSLSQLSRVFSWRKEGEHPLRSLQNEYDIKIMEIDDSGRMEFAVYGYMAGGAREGSRGISYCTYRTGDKQASEQMFLPSGNAPASIIRDGNRLLTKGNDHFLYFISGGELFVMDIATGETAVLVSRDEFRNLVIRGDETALAWSTGSEQDIPSALRIVDLSSGSRVTKTAEEGRFIKPLGYIRNDLVIGGGPSESDMIENGHGKLFPMDEFMILDDKLDELTKYHQDNIWLNGLDISDEKITIHRFEYLDRKYNYRGEDVILRSDTDQSEVSRLTGFQHDGLKRMLILSYARLPSFLRIRSLSLGEIQMGRTVSLPKTEAADQTAYYAFGNGRLLGKSDKPGEAIHMTSGSYGYVLDNRGRMEWSWCSRLEEKILEPGAAIWAEGAGGWKNVSHINLRELIYYLNNGKTVQWVSPERGSVWLTGYEWQNVVLYDPDSGVTERMLQSEFDELLKRENNYLWYYSD